MGAGESNGLSIPEQFWNHGSEIFGKKQSLKSKAQNIQLILLEKTDKIRDI